MSEIKINEQELKDIDLFIFDKDGTLIDIHHYWCSMIKYRATFLLEKFDLDSKDLYFKLIDSMGIDLKTDLMKPTGPVGLKPRSFIIDTAYICLKNASVECTFDEVSEIFKKVDEYSKDKLEDIIKILPGVKELINRLTDIGIPVTIATTDQSQRAKLAMETLQLGDAFSVIAGGNCAKSAKPDPDLVHFICKKMGVNEDRTVVVGDSIVDLKMAFNAGARFIGVKTGLFSEEFIENSEFLVETLEQIKIEK